MVEPQSYREESNEDPVSVSILLEDLVHISFLYDLAGYP